MKVATTLIKLVMSAETVTTTNLLPDVKRYFYFLSEDERDGDTITIPASEFVDDEGNPVVDNLTTVTTDNGFYNLYVNGALQQTSLYTVEEDGSQVEISQGSTVPLDAPIILVVTNFAPVSTSTTTVTS
jgi:hypothetical protein